MVNQADMMSGLLRDSKNLKILSSFGADTLIEGISIERRRYLSLAKDGALK